MYQDSGTIRRATAPKVTVRTDVPRHLWQSMHDADPEAMPTQAPEWIDCLTATGRFHDASRLYEMRDGRLALLPLVRSTLPGHVATYQSMPSNWGYGGLISPQGVDIALVSAVLDDLTNCAALRVHLRPNPLHGSIWAAAVAGRRGITTVVRTSHIIDLDGGFDRVWRDGFKSANRRAVRRAEKLGVTIETDTTGRLVPVFYELLLRSFERWAAQQNEPLWLARRRGRHRDPIDKFHAIAAKLGERCQVSVAWFEDKPAAASIVLRGGGNAHDTRGAMDKALSAPSKANSLLQKATIEAACRDGCRHYHLGESGNSAALAAYKSGFGATSYQFAEYWIERVPLYRMGTAVRDGVKRTIGFRDV